MMTEVDAARKFNSKAPPVNILENENEKKHFCRILSAFKCYRQHSLDRIGRNAEFIDTLSIKHQNLLHKYSETLDDFRTCVHNNQQLLNLIVKHVVSMFENVETYPHEVYPGLQLVPQFSDVEKVHIVLKQLVRDWSIEGAEERQSCYDPIVNAIVDNFPPSLCDPSEVKVLVPGAGLGRLTYEIVNRGYSCEGNEFSLFMLFASNFVLNNCHGVNSHHIHPWLHQFDNNLSTKDQMRIISFPDVNPANLGRKKARFTMTAGDFLEIYNTKDEWDCVATCYFIDCAPNILSFIESIYNILKPGGLWINFGPLLYHFNNSSRPESVELSYEDLKDIIIGFGFKYEKEELNIDSKYCENRKSMLQHFYKCLYFICRKPIQDTVTNVVSEMNTSLVYSEDIEPASEQTRVL